MKLKTLLITAALLTAVFTVPANALEYTVDGASGGIFGAPTSDETVYVETSNTANVDKSKNVALIPPSFGTPTSNLLESGEPLTPNLIRDTGTVTEIRSSSTSTYSSTGGTIQIASNTTVSESPNADYTAYTAVTSDLYYSRGYLGTLEIPTQGLNVKVYQGTDETQLAKGAGHFTNTSVWDGNVAVAGHNRGVNCYFGNIHTLDNGDRIILTTKLGTRIYAVTGVYKVDETDRSMLSATAENCITLFTCVRNERAFRWCVRAEEIK